MKAIIKQQIIKRLVTSVAITTSIDSLIGLTGFFAYRSGDLSRLLNFTKVFGLNPIATLAILASIIVAFTLLFVCLVIFRDRIFCKRIKTISEEDKKLAEEYLKKGDTFKKEGNYEDAFKNYKLSADLGNDRAQFKVGKFYSTGITEKDKVIVSRDDKLSLKYYKLSAKNGNPDANKFMGYHSLYEY